MVKPCPCGGIPTVSSSLRSGSCLWCPDCWKTLSKGSYSYDDRDGPIIEWVHGIDALPPKCPFCKFPPKVTMADTESPLIFCQFPVCPLHSNGFTLKQWNMCRPEAWAFEHLVARWKKKLAKDPVRALKRAIKDHVRGRLL